MDDVTNHRRWQYRFTVRTLLALVAIAAMPCYWISFQVAGYRAEQAALAKLAPFHPAIRMRGRRIQLMDRVYSVILENDPSLTDEDMDALVSFSQIEGLDIRNNKITDAGLAPVEGLTSITEMDLWQVAISDRGIRHLRRLRNLEELGLRRTMATEKSLDVLVNLPKLRRLVLEGMQLSEAGVQTLSRFKSLQFLYVDGAEVSTEGLEMLRQALPRTFIFGVGDSRPSSGTPAHDTISE